MRAKAPVLAKLSLPALHSPVPRERLFALLDRHRAERRGIVIVGPPGAGKTTLLASWLDARLARAMWYQVDAGDADLPTFFYYLTVAAEPYRRRGQRLLPLLLPEYQSDVPAFARRFFREFFGRLPTGTVVAFDNFQEVRAEESCHRIVALALDEAPPGIVLAVVSRRDPPACYARLVANEYVGLIDWDLLKLDQGEAEAIGRCHHIEEPERLARIHEVTGGWAAGLVLALESARHALVPEAIPDSTRNATFSYFAAEIFERVPAETQRFLMATALLPDVPLSVAEQLTGNRNAPGILEDLFERHYFTHRKPGPEPIYWYHALFRSFLLRQGLRQTCPGDLDALRLRAARLIDSRDPGAALDLFGEVGAWEEAEALIVRDAPALIGQGRSQLVVARIRALPEKRRTTSHRLSCWLGLAMAASDPVKARGHLERSFTLAARHADAQCRVSAASGVIQTYLMDYNAFRPLDEWAEALLQAIGDTRFTSAAAEVMARSALVTAFGFRQPNRPELAGSALRVLELIPEISDVNLRLSAAVSVLAWGSLAGPIEFAHRALPFADSLWRHPDVVALNAAVAGHLISWYHCYLRDRVECERVLRDLQEIHHQYDLPAAGAYAATIGVWLEIYDGRVDAAVRWLNLLLQTADVSRPFDRAMIDGIKGWIAMLRGETAIGLEHNRRSVATYDELGSLPHQILFRQHVIWNTIELGDFDAAHGHIADSRKLLEGFGANRFELDLSIAEAHIAVAVGDRGRSLDRLRNAFSLSRAQGMDYGWNALHRWISPLCAVALEEGIERDHVCRLIRRYRWAVPAARPEAWPWPVRVHTLGRFQVWVDERPLTFSHKTPRRPIALLKAIVAFGERHVSVSRLMDALWPDEDGDSAYHNFGLTLHRLRKLLGLHDAILLDQGKVSLNPDLVWADATVLLDALSGREGLDRVLNAYRGAFLAGSDEDSWAIAVRDQFRQRFVACVVDAAQQRESAGDTAQACSWYQRAQEVEPLVEEFTRGLMRCHTARGEHQRAEAAFEALKARLAAQPGAGPSSKTTALARELTLAGDGSTVSEFNRNSKSI